ncbi:MAG TPA: hypothetical protein VFD31_06525 [Thermoleophilaceae bacterium]|nr:hypothetical protein [Thermoleophilaceae bacterium]
MARRSLKPQLNQIRTWVRQGRTDAWIAHQLDVSVKDISAFKREHELAPADQTGAESDLFGPRIDEEEPDLRAEDEALVAAALEAESNGDGSDDDDGGGEASGDSGGDDDEDDGKPQRRRRGRRGGRGRGRARKALDGTFDHGEEGYGLWLDPAVQDDPVYAEHWAGHRPVTATIEPDRIVITRTGEDAGGDDS